MAKSRDEGGETRQRSRRRLDPGKPACGSAQIDGRGHCQVLQVGLGQAPVAQLAQPETPHALREGALHTGPQRISLLRFALPSRTLSLVGFPGM